MTRTTTPILTSPLTLRTAAHQIQGPRDRQEDALLHAPDLGLFGVFDGMGGERDGDRNSHLASSTLLDRWSGDGCPRTDGGLSRAWAATLDHLDRELPHGDTTATVGVVLGGGRCLLVRHIGDSAITRLRGGEATRLTERHGEGHWVFKTMRGEWSARHGRRQRETPDLHILPLIPGDVLVFHTDGLDDVMASSAPHKLALTRDPRKIAIGLCAEAMLAQTEDNASCVVIVVDAPTPTDASALEAAGRWAGVGVDGGLMLAEALGCKEAE